MSSGIPSPAPKRPKKVLGASLVAFESAAEAALPESSASSMCSGTSSMKRLTEAEYELEVAKQHAIMNEMRAQQQQLVMQQNLDASTIRTHVARVEMINRLGPREAAKLRMRALLNQRLCLGQTPKARTI